MRALILALILSTPTLAFAEDSDHLSEKDGVRLLHGWARATTGDHAEVFVEIENGSGKEILLTGGSAEIADEVELLGAPIKAGDDPLELDAFPIAEGAEFDLSPNSIFLELHGLKQPLAEGGHFDMIVEFATIGGIEIEVEVEAADADNHSHAGHNH